MNIYQHFRPEEREFIDQVLDWKQLTEDSFSPKLTDFLDPRKQQIVRTVVGGGTESKVDFFGGLEACERKRALIYPQFFNVLEDDFEVQLFEINYPKKFVTIEHSHVLGSLMSLGLKRGKFGDILTQDGRVQFFASNEVSQYIEQELTAIGRTAITLERLPFAEGLKINTSWHEMTTTVSSLRLDAVISAAYNLSRQKSLEFIKQGVVKLNWVTLENPAFECAVEDVISVRGHGRSKLIAIEGKTKKDKWRITVGKHK